MEAPLAVLKRVWGYDSFRGCQQEVVDAVLAGHDNLVVMATGGGKSLCYQVPALVLRRPAVVVSPLISLMEDQVMALTARGVKACFLGSAQLSAQVREDAWAGRYQFVYVTPELAANAIGRLQALRDSVGLSLVAVDEAHCISEWGFDFRTEYRTMYRLREALPDVPFLALTATATPQVRHDIAANLRLKPDARKWLMSFERGNLHFSVRRKAGGAAANFAELLGAAARGAAEPTIVYTLTKREAADIAAELGAKPGLQGRVAAYHSDLPIAQRRDVHAAFMHDRLAVVVATVAFGMGIDKGNVRRVYHFGAPASLEAYYQQAGRAGRDGVQSHCVLLWSAADAATNAMIKSGDHRSAEASAQRDSGGDAITAYIHAPGCRHRAMVEYFSPDSWQPQADGTCKGGCDNCAASSAGGVVQRELGGEARLLLATVQRLREMGLGTAVSVLRGSRAQRMKPWMFELTAPDGTRLHGAGAQYSEGWWKALAGILTGRGLLAGRAVSHAGQRAYAAVTCTEAGAAFVRAPQPLLLQLSGEMLQHERAAAQAAAAAAAAEAAHAALQQQRDALAGEQAGLLRALKAVRVEAAAVAGVAPFQLVSDFALAEMVRLRPGSTAHLAACQGCTELFVRNHGAAFVTAIAAFCATSPLLRLGDPAREQALAQQIGSQGTPAAGGCSQAAACLSEPKGAATEAYQRFQAQGQSVSVIATTGRPKPISPLTVVGYLADAANSGLPLDWARAAADAGLTEGAAAAIAEGILAHGQSGLGAIKRALPTAEYGAIKLVAAMMNTLGRHWPAPTTPTPPPAARAGGGGENQDANGAGADATPQPDAKRRRPAGDGPGAPQQPQQAQQPAAQQRPPAQALDRGTVRGWIAAQGPVSGPQLLARFCDGGRDAAAADALRGLVGGLVEAFEVCRRGGASATCSAIQLDDPEVQFMAL